MNMTRQEAVDIIASEWISMKARLMARGIEDLDVGYDQMDDAVYASFKYRIKPPHDGDVPWWAWETDAGLSDVFPS